MDLWFRVLHKAPTEVTYILALQEMWHIVAAGDKYHLDIAALYDWYAAWYKKQDLGKLSAWQLLYPCWRFNNAEGFLTATHTVVCESVGHIMEKNFEEHYELHLPPRIIREFRYQTYSTPSLT